MGTNNNQPQVIDETLGMTETQKFMFLKLKSKLGDAVPFCELVPNCISELSEDRKKSLGVTMTNFKKKLPEGYIISSVRNAGYIMLKK